MFELTPNLVHLYVSFIPVVFFLFLPAFWLYHDATIATDSWRWQPSMLKHFAIVPVVLFLSVALALLPAKDFEWMFFSSEPVDTPWLTTLAMAFAFFLVVWFILSCGYMFSIFRRTLAYHKNIRLIYADESGRKLNWVIITAALMILTWVYALIVLTVENRLTHFGFSETGVLILLSLIVWLVAHNGIKQQLGFDEAKEANAAITEVIKAQAYERSALRKADLQRIAAKIETAVAQDKIHLESDLSLVKLAKHIAEPPQYISQTLSQHLNSTFFDFINKARIDQARQLLATTDHTVLDIAFATGFNSRSAFYKAFKNHLNQTPSEYRANSS
ncbi:helix-turn-helix transcriptional regulator [Pseudidiomarina salilacus]|uniref:helix-turn-helix transcriptional regulator n=1 Tax=Pseudidiomarina salilacus TaxID=3384452 RepID=UPI003984E7A8